MQLTIHFRVPLNGSMLFNRWLPLGHESALALNSSKYHVRLWFDLECLESRGQSPTKESVTNEVSAVKTVIVECVATVDDALAHFIFENHDWPQRASILDSTDSNVRNYAMQYQQLGKDALEEVVRTVNLLSAWVYADKNHHWLRLLRFSTTNIMSQNQEFRSRVSAPDRDPVRWCPPNDDRITLCNPYAGDYITLADWTSIADHLSRSQRPSAIKEFLSNGNAMLDQGHLRSAVLEAVIALELALNKFSQSPDKSMFRDDRVYATHDLASNVKHLGFSTSVSHLLPLVLPESFLDAQLLSRCSDAIACRQNITHTGQRKLTETDASQHVTALRVLTKKLLSVTVDDSD